MTVAVDVGGYADVVDDVAFEKMILLGDACNADSFLTLVIVLLVLFPGTRPEVEAEEVGKIPIVFNSWSSERIASGNAHVAAIFMLWLLLLLLLLLLSFIMMLLTLPISTLFLTFLATGDGDAGILVMLEVVVVTAFSIGEATDVDVVVCFATIIIEVAASPLHDNGRILLGR